jgi:hypothetical protein
MSIRRPLDLIEVQSPCSKDWNRMSGCDSKRFCDHCQRHVHDLSAMTLGDAEALICQQAGELCVRFTRMPDGQVKTLDYCAATMRKGFGWRFWTVVVAIAAAIGGCVLGNHGTRTMGAICPPSTGATTNPVQPPPCQTP